MNIPSYQTLPNLALRSPLPAYNQYEHLLSLEWPLPIPFSSTTNISFRSLLLAFTTTSKIPKTHFSIYQFLTPSRCLLLFLSISTFAKNLVFPRPNTSTSISSLRSSLSSTQSLEYRPILLGNSLEDVRFWDKMYVFLVSWSFGQIPIRMTV